MEGMQTAAKEKESVTISAAGDELFEGGGVMLGKLWRFGLNLSGGGMPRPGIGDAYISEAMPDSPFQILSSSFAEPTEKEFVGKEDFERIVRRKGEGKGGEPSFCPLHIQVCLEPVFYLHGIGNKGRILPGREGEYAPFAGI